VAAFAHSPHVACRNRYWRAFILPQVPLPNPDERVAILAKHVRNMPLASDIDISRIGRDCRMQGFSGADVAGLCREAAMFCIKGNLGSDAIDSALVRVGLRLLLARALLTAAAGDNAAF
jgi:SpoVK/Ycf46/Vps4 family AAA+-type ATPase